MESKLGNCMRDEWARWQAQFMQGKGYFLKNLSLPVRGCGGIKKSHPGKRGCITYPLAASRRVFVLENHSKKLLTAVANSSVDETEDAIRRDAK